MNYPQGPGGHPGGYGGGPPPQQGQPSGLQFHCEQGQSWLAPNPTALINGHKHQLRWGPCFVPMPPGQYQLEVSYPWIFGGACKAHLMVQVQPGHMTLLHYKPAVFIFSAGTLYVIGVQPMPMGPPMGGPPMGHY